MLTKIYKIILCFTLLITFFIPNLAYAESESENLYKSGNAYYDKWEFALAIDNYTKAIKLNPQYAKAYNNRGLAYYHVYQYDLAIADYTKAIELNPQHAGAYCNRGDSYKVQAEYRLAIVNYSKAIELNPQDTDCYIKRAEVYRGLRNALAMDDYNQVLKMKPDDDDAYRGKRNLLKYGGAGNYNYYDSYIRDTSYNPFR